MPLSFDFEGSRKHMRPIFNVSPWKQILDFQLANAAFEVKKAKGFLDATLNRGHVTRASINL